MTSSNKEHAKACARMRLEVIQWAQANGCTHTLIQDWQIRVANDLQAVDIFPISRKYHNIMTGRRGTIGHSAEGLLNSIFSQKGRPIAELDAVNREFACQGNRPRLADPEAEEAYDRRQRLGNLTFWLNDTSAEELRPALDFLTESGAQFTVDLLPSSGKYETLRLVVDPATINPPTATGLRKILMHLHQVKKRMRVEIPAGSISVAEMIAAAADVQRKALHGNAIQPETYEADITGMPVPHPEILMPDGACLPKFAVLKNEAFDDQLRLICLQPPYWIGRVHFFTGDDREQQRAAFIDRAGPYTDPVPGYCIALELETSLQPDPHATDPRQILTANVAMTSELLEQMVRFFVAFVICLRPKRYRRYQLEGQDQEAAGADDLTRFSL